MARPIPCWAPVTSATLPSSRMDRPPALTIPHRGPGCLAAALAGSLVELFLARVVLGAIGATSTLAFMLASREPNPGERRQRLGMIQFANMGGQVLAPLVGAATAARLGFRVSFLLGGLMLGGCAVMLQWGNLRILPPPAPTSAARRRLPLQI